MCKAKFNTKLRNVISNTKIYNSNVKYIRSITLIWNLNIYSLKVNHYEIRRQFDTL